MREIGNSKLCPILNAKIMSQSKEELPVIVQLVDDDAQLKNGIMNLATKVQANLPLINALACNLTTDTIYGLANNPDIKYISFDSKVFTQLDTAAPTIAANISHENGYTGKGITIAVIDTGISPHLDLTQPYNRIVGFKDLVNKKNYPYDDNGHGTHVAGIIAGNGYSSNKKYIGVAPESNILAIKALNKNGSGSTSSIIEAISYIVESKDQYNTKIVNFSMGTPANNSCNKDPLCRAVEKAIQSGIVVVAAAGNSGPGRGTIVSPGISKNVITVGAVDHKGTVDTSDDSIAPFSSRGPTLEGFKKPDLYAPGVNINSLSNTKLDTYSSLSGTSMATPLVSGDAALLLDKYNNITPRGVKDRLINASIDIKGSQETQGAGLLNLKLLFSNEDNILEDKPQGSIALKGKLLEALLILLVIIFLLDSKI